MDHRRLLQNLYWQASRANCLARHAADVGCRPIADFDSRVPSNCRRCGERLDHADARVSANARLAQLRFDLISLAEVQRRIAGRNHRPAVAITFDDGYAINCDLAMPLLIAERIPCTYFVCNDPVLRQIPFAHDQQIGRPLPPNTLKQLRGLAKAGIEIGAIAELIPTSARSPAPWCCATNC